MCVKNKQFVQNERLVTKNTHTRNTQKCVLVLKKKCFLDIHFSNDHGFDEEPIQACVQNRHS